MVFPTENFYCLRCNLFLEWTKPVVGLPPTCLPFLPESYLLVELKRWESVSLVFNQPILLHVSSLGRFKSQDLSDSLSFFLLSLFLFLGGSGREEGSKLELLKPGPVGLELLVATGGEDTSPLPCSVSCSQEGISWLSPEPDTARGAQEFQALQSWPLPLPQRPWHLKKLVGCLAQGFSTSLGVFKQLRKILPGKGHSKVLCE